MIRWIKENQQANRFRHERMEMTAPRLEMSKSLLISGFRLTAGGSPRMFNRIVTQRQLNAAPSRGGRHVK